MRRPALPHRRIHRDRFGCYTAEIVSPDGQVVHTTGAYESAAEAVDASKPAMRTAIARARLYAGHDNLRD
jgi:hypothetical protein